MSTSTLSGSQIGCSRVDVRFGANVGRRVAASPRRRVAASPPGGCWPVVLFAAVGLVAFLLGGQLIDWGFR